MATVDLPVQDQLALLATEPAFVAADAGGHTVDNRKGREVMLIIDNASGASITLTVYTARRSNFGTFPNKTMTIIDGATVTLPTFWAGRFTDVVTGKLRFELSATTNVQVAAILPGMVSEEA